MVYFFLRKDYKIFKFRQKYRLIYLFFLYWHKHCPSIFLTLKILYSNIVFNGSARYLWKELNYWRSSWVEVIIPNQSMKCYWFQIAHYILIFQLKKILMKWFLPLAKILWKTLWILHETSWNFVVFFTNNKFMIRVVIHLQGKWKKEY